MILKLSKEYYGEGVSVTFPATAAQIREKMAELEKLGPDTDQAVFIRGEGLAWHFEERIKPADLGSETGIQKLNQLAEAVDGMDVAAQKVFAGALRAESINGVDDILRIASSLDQYEFIEDVTSDKELGGWLVEHGLAGVDFPEEVRPYLDYAGIGAEYYADHGGAYTPNGYVKRRETVMVQEKEAKAESVFSVTLSANGRQCPLELPASEDELRRAGRALGVSTLDDAELSGFQTGYLWSRLMPTEGFTVAYANELACCIERMGSDRPKFAAALEVEEPDCFGDALDIAIDMDDYELVDGNESAYGREKLRSLGADDDLLCELDGYTDFELLGRDAMEEDGVRSTSCGLIRRLSRPFLQPEPRQDMTMGGLA